ncbi:Rv0340 family IniB-related protein [Mycobacterium terramassiliense]|uniref:Rv0340 family IniB-related protein n=1 Tax=Mycobacterium terramassiliense TaxID=1841859 RepID=UPI00097DE26D|nr:IniB N-terminal domain-containing protein [Mycobacterium terramassiliense]
MANSLLDFVISLVRDPDAAARYAADPAHAIADAHLTGVTSADVNNLIPMVSDSLSMGHPAASAAGTPVVEPGNVWASGAAAAALDAFTPHAPIGVVEQHGPAPGVISQPAAPAPVVAPADTPPAGIDPHEPSVLLAGFDAPDGAVDHGVFPADDLGAWDHPDAHPHPTVDDHHGFGIHG